MKYYYVYILSDKNNNVLYVGVTNNLLRRVQEHKSNANEGFSSKYHTHKLVYYEEGLDSYGAISREKQLKGLNRFKKMKLIESFNSNWDDLYYKILKEMNE